MYIFIDLQWFKGKNDSYNPTQIYAVKTDENLEVISTYGTILCHKNIPNKIWRDEPAFFGYSGRDFARGANTNDVLRHVSRFIGKNDIIITWDKKVKDALDFSLIQVGKKYKRNQSVYVKDIAAQLLTYLNDFDSIGFVADSLCIENFGNEHRSEDVAQTLVNIINELSGMSGFNELFYSAMDKELTSERSLRNSDFLKNSESLYFSARGSQVYHLSGCSHLLNAAIIDSHYMIPPAEFKPCKKCHPERKYETCCASRGGEYTKTRLLKDYAGIGKTPVPILQQTVKIAVAPLPAVNNELRKVKVACNGLMEINNKNIIGFCHYAGHPGMMTKSLLMTHNCLGKKCTYLQRYEEKPFWQTYYREQALKEKRKLKLKAEKMTAAKDLENMESIRNIFQEEIDSYGYKMEIVRLKKENEKVLTVFYVSCYPFADGHMFPAFLTAVSEIMPNVRLSLRHIKDIHGRFVTIDEYRTVKKCI